MRIAPQFAGSSFASWLITGFAYVFTRSIYSTMRVAVVGEEKIEAARNHYGGVIMATWHGRTFVPITYFRGRGYWTMISTSRDGNYQNVFMSRLGYKTVRGSTSNRGAISAALKMAKELRNGAVLAFTPDGPRGPSHKVHPGAIFLAEKSGCPILPAGVSSYPSKCLKAWDKHQIPLPFSRCAIIFGDPIEVPGGLDEAMREQLGERLGTEMTRLEQAAEEYVRAAPAFSVTRADVS